MLEKSLPERNITLDYFKLILSILIITIHMRRWGEQGIEYWLISEGIARMGVPCFFLINGYFLKAVFSDVKHLFKYLVHLVLIYVVWLIINQPEFLPTVTMSSKILRIIFEGYYHLWYIIALMQASIILYLIRNLKPVILLCSTLMLFLAGWYLQNGTYILNSSINTHMIELLTNPRNFLFMGLPFLTLGFLIAKIKKEQILKISSKVLITVIVIGFTLLISESTYLFTIRETIHDPRFDFYFSLIILCPALFILILRKGRRKQSDGYISKFASAIYFSHVIVLTLLSSIGYTQNMRSLGCTIFLCLLFAAGVVALNKRIKIFL